MESTRILRDELIGKSVTVVDSTNKSNIGVNGKIIDETKNSIVINHQDKKKRLMKDCIVLQMEHDGAKIQFNASLVGLRPEERIKGHKTTKGQFGQR